VIDRVTLLHIRILNLNLRSGTRFGYKGQEVALRGSDLNQNLGSRPRLGQKGQGQGQGGASRGSDLNLNFGSSPRFFFLAVVNPIPSYA
jgi:hypothetical protein